MASMDCDECFVQALRDGSLPGHHLYYKDAEAYESHSEVCEYDEVSVWERPQVLEQLLRVIRHIADC